MKAIGIEKFVRLLVSAVIIFSLALPGTAILAKGGVGD